jgi:hypothetical protein
MKTLLKTILTGALLLTVLASPSWADGGNDGGRKNIVRWATIVGIIQAENRVAGIIGGGQPWSTLGGSAYVNLLNGLVAFNVKGLVLAGGNSIGTPGTINQVQGALVCSPGSNPVVINTRSVPLDAQGNASFYGAVAGVAAASCSPTDVAFLITVPANGHWIANGAVRVP